MTPPTAIAVIVAGLALLYLAAYVIHPWLRRRSASLGEAKARLAGDEIVPRSTSGYPLAITVEAPPSAVWSGLEQLGQGAEGSTATTPG